MRIHLLSALLVFIILQSCTTSKDSTNEEPGNLTETMSNELDPSLTMLWDTDTTLTTVESVLYVPSENILYASCISGNPTDKDGRGFISKLSTSGEILELEWANTLNAPKGMAIAGNYLYVTDIDRLVEIELKTGEIHMNYTVDGAQFLNDVTTDGSSVWFSDMATGKIHKLQDGEIITLATGLNQVNGLSYSDESIYFLDASGLGVIRPDDNREIINSSVTNGDGLIVVDSSTFIASRWEGEIYLIKGGNEYLLLDTKAQSINSADIGYIPDGQIILVPTFFKNKIVAYKLNY